MGVSVGRQELKRGQFLVKKQQVTMCCWAKYFSLIESRELAILMEPQGPLW